MKIYFENIKEEGLHWKGTLDPDSKRLGEDFAHSKNTEIEFNIYPFKNMYRLTGKIKGIASLRCSRCLEDYTHEYDIKFQNILVQEPLSNNTDEVELKDEDMCYSFNHGEGIDMIDIITEQILLNMPMKTLCSDNCKGLCEVCGANLNKNHCECHKNKKVVDPRFAVLAEIKRDIKK